MKTFEEACRATFVRSVETEAEERSAQLGIVELSARWEPMIEEIRNSLLTQVYLRGTIGAVGQGLMEPHAAFFSMFVAGIVIGAEMYRQDDMPTDSVPGRREGYTGV